ARAGARGVRGDARGAAGGPRGDLPERVRLGGGRAAERPRARCGEPRTPTRAPRGWHAARRSGGCRHVPRTARENHTMKAAVVHSFDRPLVIEDVPTPEPGPEQVLVR